MLTLRIKRITPPNDCIELNSGEYTLGRGKYLRSTCNHISRNHILIKITDCEVHLRVLRHNRVLCKRNDDEFIVKKKKSIQLLDGDEFSLNSKDGWYKVEIFSSDERMNESNLDLTNGDNNTLILKRHLKYEICERKLKKSRHSKHAFDDDYDGDEEDYEGNTEDESDIHTSSKPLITNISAITEIPELIQPQMMIEHNDSLTESQITVIKQKDDSVDLQVAGNGIVTTEISEEPSIDAINIKIEKSDDVTVKTETPDDTADSQITSNVTNGEVTEHVIIKMEPEDFPVEPQFTGDIIVKTETPEETSVDPQVAGNIVIKTEIPDGAFEEQQNTNNVIIKTEVPDCDLENIDCPKPDTSSNVPIKTESVSNANDLSTPSTSGNLLSSWKDRCWYGRSCYRKNPEHRSKFKHPGDADFDSDPNDPRPFCVYGLACYRKNKLHRMSYRHCGQEKIAGKPKRPPRGHLKTKAVKPEPKSEPESPELADYMDLFSDYTTDEYMPSSSSDSDSLSTSEYDQNDID